MQRRISLRDELGLSVEVRGQGHGVLLVHGFTGSSAAWTRRIIDALAQDRCVVAVDLLGHGQSDTCHRSERFALEQVLEDLCEVLDALNLERCTWIGYSMGGRIALGAAILCPERVDGLVLEGASPGLRTAPERDQRREADEELARALETDGLEAFVDRWMSQPLFASQQALRPEIRSVERARRLLADPGSLAACLRGLGTGAQPSFWPALGKLRARSLLLFGELDTKFAAIAREMAAAIPQAHRRAIPGAGHTTHLEKPDAWLAAVCRFDRGVQEQGRPR
jgi:2-succinyl-6-hydroxy-2,4-cyclohexadiene-1-carboxylate synthase